VVAEILGVVKLVPVPNELPPVAAAYQLTVPADAVAPKTTLPVPQVEPGVVPVIVGIAFRVAVTTVLEAVVQPLFVAST
jgi:hypothetical protein